MQVKIKSPLYKVTIIEMDRFRGSEVLDTKLYDNQNDADAEARKVNSKNTADSAPECYIYAKVTKVL